MNEDLTRTMTESQLGRLTHEVEKLNKRAAKLGCPALTIVEHADELRPDQDAIRHIREYYGETAVCKRLIEALPKIRYITVELVGAGPVIDGYRFVGKLDHRTVEGAVLVQTVPGETIPEEFWDAKPICDHCDTQRYRKDTFVFQHEDGTYKQVGRSCLRDFFGHSPMALLNIAMYAYTLGDEEDDERGSYGRMDVFYDPQRILEVTAAVIRTCGWVSRSKAAWDQTPTSSHVDDVLNPPRDTEGKRKWREFVASIQWDEEKDKAEAEGAVAWLAEQEATSEYMHNLKAVAADPRGVSLKAFGLWLSLMAVYQRAQERLEYAAKTLRVNEHVGTVKERSEYTVTCEMIRSWDSDWGVTHMHKFLTVEGHTLVWYGSKRIAEQGDKLVIKATVKKHDEYNGWKQTVITRAAFVEFIEEAA